VVELVPVNPSDGIDVTPNVLFTTVMSDEPLPVECTMAIPIWITEDDTRR
jgi:hypothetical protein